MLRSPGAERVAVLGFYSDAEQNAALRRTFEGFHCPNKQLFLYPAEHEGELYSISLELGRMPVAAIHPGYAYPPSYLDELMAACTDPSADAVWTACQGPLPGEATGEPDPDVYASLIPAHVFRLFYTKANRHIAVAKRGARSRAVRVHSASMAPPRSNGSLPHRLQRQNGLYGLVDYAHRMDRRCIEAYLAYRKLGAALLAQDHEDFLASLSPLQRRHLQFFLNTNIAGKRTLDYLAEQIDLSKLQRVVDVGSGWGGLVKALSGLGCSATGLELLRPLLDIAKVNVSGYDVELIQGDFLEESLPADTYDLVTMTDVIEHVADVERAIERTVSVLRAGGHAYVKVPNSRFIDHVREDSHTGLFGITLLPHEPAAAYLRASRNMRYSVGEYCDYDYYIRAFARRGATLAHADNVTRTPASSGTLLDECRRRFERWEVETQSDAGPRIGDELRALVRQAATEYLDQFERASKPRPDALFLRDYMSSHWRMFFRKQG